MNETQTGHEQGQDRGRSQGLQSHRAVQPGGTSTASLQHCPAVSNWENGTASGGDASKGENSNMAREKQYCCKFYHVMHKKYISITGENGLCILEGNSVSLHLLTGSFH